MFSPISGLPKYYGVDIYQQFNNAISYSYSLAVLYVLARYCLDIIVDRLMTSLHMLQCSALNVAVTKDWGVVCLFKISSRGKLSGQNVEL